MVQCCACLAFTLVLWSPILLGQDAAPEKEVVKSRMSLSANQYPDATIALDGLVRARIEGSYQKVPMVQVQFYSVDPEGEETVLGEAETGENGVATVEIETAALPRDEAGYFTFVARFEGDNDFSASETDVRIHPAKLTLTPLDQDSIYTLRFQASAISPEGDSGIADAVVSVFVKRMFSALKVGEGTTDEDGVVEIEFPTDLSGDENANIQITARIDETDEYGNLVARTTESWGSMVSKEIKELPPALWSAHPPIWMFVTFTILMGAVWIHYVIILFQLLKIRKIGSA